MGRAARLRRGVPLAPRSTATFRRPRAVRPAAGAQSADAGRCAAAVGPSLAATSPPIVSDGGRALPAALGPGSGAACVWRGFSTGRYRAPSLAARSRSEPGGARAGPRLFPGLACRSGSDSCRRSILSPCPRTVASWKAAFTALCIPRARFPGPSCSRLRQVSACRLSPPLLTLSDGGLDVGAFATSPLTFGPI